MSETASNTSYIEEAQIKRRKIHIGILICCILACCLAVGILTWKANNESYAFHTERAVPFPSEWYVMEDGKKEVVTLPVTLPTKKGEDRTIYGRVPNELVEGATLCLHTISQGVRVQIEDRIIYERGMISKDGKKDIPGNYWNLVRILEKDKGKQLSITIESHRNNRSGHFPEVYFGSKSANLFLILEKNLGAMLASALIFLVGMILIVMEFVITDRVFRKGYFLYLGIFAMLLSTWCFCEAQMLQFFVGNPVIVQYLTHYLVLLLPLSILLFYDVAFEIHHKSFFSGFYMVFGANCIIDIVLQVCFGICIIRSITIAHMLIVLAMLAIASSLTYEIIKYKNKAARNFLCSFGIVGMAVIIEIGLYYIPTFIQSGIVLCVGFLLYLLIVICICLRNLNQTFLEAKESKYFEKLAYYDVLTNAKNRTAYYEHISGIVRDGKLGSIWLVLLDVNNLKTINDVYGHNEGDHAIRSICLGAEKAFADVGVVYRIGGDEFAVIIDKGGRAEIKKRILYLKGLLKDMQEGKAYALSIAVGYDQCMRDHKETFENLYIRVDRMMYENKKQEKKGI